MIAIVRQHVIPAAYSVLPSAMASPLATRHLLAIGWQESRLIHRVQLGGPARGLFQFELGGGVLGVLGHARTKTAIRDALVSLGYTRDLSPYGCYTAIQHNDILAAVFARLLLWTLPSPLPTEEAEGWRQYLAAWRPGEPHPATWPDAWAVAA